MLDAIEKWTSGDEPDPLKGAVAGAVGGLVGTLRMGWVSSLWNKVNKKFEQSETTWVKPLVKRQGKDADPLPPFGDATESRAEQRVAAAVAKKATGTQLGPHDRAIGGEIVHKSTGILIGAAWGVAVEYAPPLRRTHGVLLGMASYLVGRQLALRATGLAPRLKNQPPADHLLGLVSHLAYGFFCETVRSHLRQSMKAD
jgi:hypothetical protein